jgi:hypothetical protein
VQARGVVPVLSSGPASEPASVNLHRNPSPNPNMDETMGEPRVSRRAGCTRGEVESARLRPLRGRYKCVSISK